MTKKANACIAFTGVALAIVGIYQYRNSVQRSALQSEIATLREQREELRPLLHSKSVKVLRPAAIPIETRDAESLPPAPMARVPSSVGSDPPIEREQDPRIHWDEEVRTAQASVEAAFITQAPDPSWSFPTARTLGDSLRSLLPPSSAIGALECRASMCRVELLHERLELAQAFSDAAFGNLSKRMWSGAMLALEPEKTLQGLRVVIYLARPGSELIERQH